MDSFPSLSENLHLYTTINKECSQVLLRMYNSLTNPVVKLQNNCLPLMSLNKYTKEITKIDFFFGRWLG